MTSIVLAFALLLGAPAFGALPGVTEFRKAPEEITDAELSSLLAARIGAADVVAIGESVHGSSGFLRIQTRLIRYLAVNHGLRLIVWENPTLRSLELSRWVAACAKGRTPLPVDVLYMPTPSDVPLWDWVCDFNRSHPDDPIVFRGMDVWDRPWEHYARIEALSAGVGISSAQLGSIRRSCPAYRDTSWRDIESVYQSLQRDGRFPPGTDYDECRSTLTGVLELARQAGAAGRKSGEPAADNAYELAISASTLLGWLGFYHYNWSDDVLSWNERDLAQGRNLMLVMEKHGASRAILSAHTSHVSHNRSPADWWGYGDLKSGVYFYQSLAGKKVFNIALTAYQASGTQGEWLLPTAASSLDRTLQEAGHALSFFFADAAFLSAHPKWWMQNGNAGDRFGNGVELVPKDHFDAYFFISRSLLDRALPQRPMWEP